MEWGEVVWFQTPRQTDQANTAGRFEVGIVVGLREISDEILVWNAEGIHRARTIKRKPANERWSAEMVAAIDITPTIYASRQQPARRTERPDGVEVREDFRTGPAAAEQPTEEPRPRATRLERRMFTVPGFTPNCPGRITLDKDDGARRGGHSTACRRRMEQHLGQSSEGREKLERASFRKTEYLEQALKKAQVSTEEPTAAQEATESGEGTGGSEQRGGASCPRRWYCRPAWWRRCCARLRQRLQ